MAHPFGLELAAWCPVTHLGATDTSDQRCLRPGDDLELLIEGAGSVRSRIDAYWPMVRRKLEG